MKNQIRITLFVLLALLASSSFAQTYYKKISYQSGHFSQALPLGYQFTVVGPVNKNVQSVTLVIAAGADIATYKWSRVSEFQTEFEIFISVPLEKGRKYTFSYDEETSKSIVGEYNKVTVEGEPIPVDTSNSTSQIGLVGGFGYAFLGTGSNRGNDMFGFIAIKFNFRKIDRTKKFLVSDNNTKLRNEVYDKPFSRFSLLVGGANTKMAYRGRELGSPLYNMKPMIGLSFNFSPEVSLDGGVIFFDYQTGDPSLHSELDSQTSIGLFASVSIDLDVFTRMKLAINGVPYDKSQKN